MKKYDLVKFDFTGKTLFLFFYHFFFFLTTFPYPPDTKNLFQKYTERFFGEKILSLRMKRSGMWQSRNLEFFT